MPARDDTDPLVGQIIDRRYRVLSRLGDGGMGIVYKVEHTALSKLLALKVMRPTKDEVDRKRFEQEARLASSIRHPNVIEISDFGVLPTDQPYYVMEFLRGHTLGDAICAGQVDPLLACHIAAQICSGLQAVHRQKVVHRDLKPDNIFLVDPDAAATPPPPAASADTTVGQGADEVAEVRFVKIMDFGIAKSIDNRLTGAGMTVGTPEYMSPEQAQGERIDWSSDQYSLGCILYEMLTGTIPFDGKGAFEIMTKQLSAPPVPPRQRCPQNAAQISPELEQLVLRMMAKKKDQRLPSMRQVETVLREQAAAMLQQRMRTHRLPAAAAQTVLLPAGSRGSQIQPTVRINALENSSEMPTRHLHAIGPDGSPSIKTRQVGQSEQVDMQKLIHKIQDKISVPSLPDSSAWHRFPLVLAVLRSLLRAYDWMRRKLVPTRP